MRVTKGLEKALHFFGSEAWQEVQVWHQKLEQTNDHLLCTLSTQDPAFRYLDEINIGEELADKVDDLTHVPLRLRVVVLQKHRVHHCLAQRQK